MLTILEKRKVRNLDTSPDLTVVTAGLGAITTDSWFLTRRIAVVRHQTGEACCTAMVEQDSLEASCLDSSDYSVQRQIPAVNARDQSKTVLPEWRLLEMKSLQALSCVHYSDRISTELDQVRIGLKTYSIFTNVSNWKQKYGTQNVVWMLLIYSGIVEFATHEM